MAWTVRISARRNFRTGRIYGTGCDAGIPRPIWGCRGPSGRYGHDARTSTFAPSDSRRFSSDRRGALDALHARNARHSARSPRRVRRFPPYGSLFIPLILYSDSLRHMVCRLNQSKTNEEANRDKLCLQVYNSCTSSRQTPRWPFF